MTSPHAANTAFSIADTIGTQPQRSSIRATVPSVVSNSTRSPPSTAANSPRSAFGALTPALLVWLEAPVMPALPFS